MSTTSLDFLQVGGLFPPSTEVARLAKYKRYDDLFYSRIKEAYSPYLKNQNGVAVSDELVKGMETIFNNPRIMNYARAITKKTVDLALSKKPYLISNKSDKDLDLIEIEHGTSIWKKVRQGLTDVSRYGNGYLREYNKIPRYNKVDDEGRATLTEGEPACNAINPSMIVEVVNPLDREDTQYFVIGWIDKVEKYPKNIGNTVPTSAQAEEEYFLTVEIHSKGEYEYKRFKVGSPVLNFGQVKQYNLIEEVTDNNLKGKKFKTGLEGFAIKKLSGFTTTDNPQEGLSDYDMLDTLMLELMQRVSQLSSVFTKHGNPSMQGGESLLSNDENGNPVFYTGDFYPIAKDEAPLSYITWDSQSKEILEYCNQILQNIWILTEMGDGTIMGYARDNNGFADSGKALRMKLASPLMKVQSILIDNQDTIVSILVDFATIMGKNITQRDIEIKWQDGLPVDNIEEATIFQTRVASNTESIVFGLQRRYNMTPEQAEKEFEQILKEKKMTFENTQVLEMQQNSQKDLTKDEKSNNSKVEEPKSRETIERSRDAKLSGDPKVKN